MKRFVLVLLVLGLMLGLAVVAHTGTVVIKDNTVDGSGAASVDVNLRSDGNDSAGNPYLNSNLGAAYGSGVRYHPETGYPNTKGPRHELVKFDVSGIQAGSTITSATLTMYFSGTGPTINDFKLARVQNDRNWLEGTHTGGAGSNSGVSAGEATWNSYAYGSGSWATPGGTGATDIDLGSAITWGITNQSGFVQKNFDVTTWVQGWVNGAQQNNGMLFYGGTGSGSSSYWWFVTNEDQTNSAYRMSLTVDYEVVPEPSSLLALAGFGIAGLGFMRRRKA